MPYLTFQSLWIPCKSIWYVNFDRLCGELDIYLYSERKKRLGPYFEIQSIENLKQVKDAVTGPKEIPMGLLQNKISHEFQD